MKLTILMYHKIDELARDVRYPGNFVSPGMFAAQMEALVSWGYQSVSFDQWLDYRDGRIAILPDKPLIVTFDDGYTCFARNAWPVVKRCGLGATVFLVAGQIGGTNAWDADERREPLLDQDAIRALQADGVHFGSHSVSHLPMAKLPAAQALDELKRSRDMLGGVLERDVSVFAYPFSNQSPEVRALARQAGYRAAVRGKGRMNWPSTDPLGLRRIKVEPSMSPEDLRRVLRRERYFRVF